MSKAKVEIRRAMIRHRSMFRFYLYSGLATLGCWQIASTGSDWQSEAKGSRQIICKLWHDNKSGGVKMQAVQQFERRLFSQALCILRVQEVKHQCQSRLISPHAQRQKCREICRTFHVSSIRKCNRNDRNDKERDAHGKGKDSTAEVRRDKEEIRVELENKDINVGQENYSSVQERVDILPGKPQSARPPDILKKSHPKLANTLEEKGYLLSDEIFAEAEKRKGQTKEALILAAEHYKKQSGKYRRGHIEFIDTACKKLKVYNLNRDKEMYKYVFTLFPEEEYIPPSRILEEFYHMPRHQDAAIKILQQMEDNGLIPDSEIREMIADRFSERSQVMDKFRRMIYWMPKFAHANPWPVPYHLPEDRIELAKSALRRMAHDVNTKIDVWTSEDIEDLQLEDADIKEDFIVSAQSSQQREFMATHPADKPVYVEGGHYVYFGRARLTFHMLRTDPPLQGNEFYGIAPDEKEEEFWSEAEEEDTAIVPEKSVHEQEDGNILSMCITGTSSKNSLVSWLRLLQDTNPNLENVTVVFKLQDPDSLLDNAEKQLSEGESGQ